MENKKKVTSRKAPEEKKSKTLNFRVTEDEANNLKIYLEKIDLSQSDFLRNAIKDKPITYVTFTKEEKEILQNIYFSIKDYESHFARISNFIKGTQMEYLKKEVIETKDNLKNLKTEILLFLNQNKYK